MRQQAIDQRIQRPGDVVGCLHPSCFRLHIADGLNVSGPKHVRGPEPERQQRILGLPFHTRPHRSPTLGTVGANTRDEAERHLAIGRHHRPRCGESQVVGHTRVLSLLHADWAHAETEEAGIACGEIGAQRVEVEEVRV